MNKEVKNTEQASNYSLKNGDWCLSISGGRAVEFFLFKSNTLVFRGNLNLKNNNLPINISSGKWSFRSGEDRLEQWCNIRDETSLSVSITYRFDEKTLCIEYLARSSIPTLLDIVHSIELVDLNYHSGILPEEFTTLLTGLQHEEKTRSHLSSTKQGQSAFREAFYCTQWIMLEKCESAA
ncbi:hypothetical protein P7F88_04375 [Vibrio hannami]|uniref:hypothetical protein n=1 Tax=Vibrio hannami TaxID=2717094 RepID=UPI00240F6852|nr:hypothetical protein [Vibrio hannami]MDG3085380.1 hypothetical protein [Vibrio hannami]